MKIIRLVNSIAFLLVFTGILSGQPISLITCIDSSLASKGTLKSKITDVEIAKLETSAAWQRYLPDLSVSYNYRYNPLIPTQIIPVGQFSPVPTDEKRPIKFGTTWQQNAGVSIYQPIIDFTLSNRVRESRINEKIRSADAEAAGRELVTEVLKSYTNIWLYQERLQAAALDTLRTYRTRELIKARWDEGKALRADINRAVMNHNNALSGYHEVNSSLAGEKIYLSYLTGLPLVVLVNGPYDFSPFTDGMIEASLAGPVSDSIPSVEILKLRKELFEQQQKTELSLRLPSVGIDGFLGANQYSENFDPALAGSWYGSSYVGLSIRVSILSGSSPGNRLKQIRKQAEGIKSELEDETNLQSGNNLRLSVEVQQLSYQVSMSEENISLLEENIKLAQEKYAAGQINSYDLLNEETELQKEKTGYNEKKAQLAYKRIELLNTSGRLNSFMDNLK